jgi:hypothetical protein
MSRRDKITDEARFNARKLITRHVRAALRSDDAPDIDVIADWGDHFTATVMRLSTDHGTRALRWVDVDFDKFRLDEHIDGERIAKGVRHMLDNIGNIKAVRFSYSDGTGTRWQNLEDAG